MILTDTHVHLYSEAFDADRDTVIMEAIENGVQRFFLPAIDSDYILRMKDLKKAYPNSVHLMSGLHPTHVKENYKKELAMVKDELDNGEYVAVGEIGIDLYWDKTFLKEQQEAFAMQIDWALEKNLPIVIHCRDAFDAVFEVLDSKRSNNLKGIFHCFTGTMEHAQKAIEHQLKLGIGGVVTFKNGKIDRFLGDIPLEHIVLETDAPYLAPTPHRGKRNKSAYLLNIANRVSEIYDKPLQEIAEITTSNSVSVFGV